jgi:hypothetical protein
MMVPQWEQTTSGVVPHCNMIKCSRDAGDRRIDCEHLGDGIATLGAKAVGIPHADRRVNR